MITGWLMLLILLAGVVALVMLPRIYCALTGRCPWSPALLQRVSSALTHWTDVLSHDWTLLLGRIREMSQNAGEDHRAGHRFVLAGLALVLAPVIVLLNAVILAQILEIFLPGSSETLTIPYLGDFMPFPFLAAIIIAFVESIAAIVLWHGSQLALRIVAGVVALVAIVAESAGGYIRARVLQGTDDITRNSANSLLGTQTAGISALISFLAPTAEMIAGVVIFEGLLAPLGYHGLRLLRIIPLWLLRGGGNLLFGPFLREPYLCNPAVANEQEEDFLLPEEAQQPNPVIHSVIQAADGVAREMLDEAVVLKTETHALTGAILGLIGGIASFMLTKVKHGPRNTVDVQPGAMVTEFNKTLMEACAQPVYQDCLHLPRETRPGNPARVYAGYTSEMLLEEIDTLDRKRTRLHLLVQQLVQNALCMTVAQLERIQQTDALLWSQDPDAKLEWEGIKALRQLLDGQVQRVERRLLHAITQRQETLQGLNDLVESPLLAEMWERSRAENLRQIKLITTRLGCDPQHEGFPALAKLFATVPASREATVSAQRSPTPGWLEQARDVIGQLLPGNGSAEQPDLLDGREAVRLLLEHARKDLATCYTYLEQASTRMHEVTDQLIEVHCLACPETPCALCPHCAQLKLTMQAQAAGVDENCAGFMRAFSVHIGQLQRLAKRKTFWGKFFSWIDDWREEEDKEIARRETRR